MASFGGQQVKLGAGEPDRSPLKNSLDFLANSAYYRFHQLYPTYQGELCL
jgi:hypothetical protein